MTLEALEKTPWPWFGGKADAAPATWEALGDPCHYVEPFMGSIAVLLRRPAVANRTYFSETVNDMDGLLVNAWRAIQLSPDATAEAASWPVSEADLHARHLALLKWRADHELEHLMGDPKWHDPVTAGWWIWGTCCWIGSGWCSGRGPWIVGPDGRILKRERAAKGDGVSRQRPHVSDGGQGVNRPQAREEGVSKQLPHVSDNGQGVNRPQSREEGVSRQRPHVSNDGQGVNHAGAREEGVSRQLPHVSDGGQGVNRPQARSPGVGEYDEDDDPDFGFHPMTMPEIRRWFAFLSARLRHVRILNGDWKRACTSGVLKTIKVRQGESVAGVFLDPPYAGAVRDADLYAVDSAHVAAEVREWCKANGADPQLRIVLAGFAGEGHEELEALGWRCVDWFKTGFLKGGMAQQGEDGHQQEKERLWLSPHCLGAKPAAPDRQRTIFDLLGGTR